MTTRTLCLLAALAMAGCTTNEHNSGLPIVSTVLATASGTTPPITCTISVSGQEVEFPVFNPTQNQLASTGFVVANQLTDPSTINPILRTDSTSFSPHQAVVDYEVPGAAVAEQIIKISGESVASGATSAVLVPLFSPVAVFSAVQTLAGTGGGVVRTTTRIEGFLEDGSTVSTSQHDYVIQVVAGCTVASDPTCVLSTPCF
jgi:hypothetical protein